MSSWLERCPVWLTNFHGGAVSGGMRFSQGCRQARPTRANVTAFVALQRCTKYIDCGLLAVHRDRSVDRKATCFFLQPTWHALDWPATGSRLAPDSEACCQPTVYLRCVTGHATILLLEFAQWSLPRVPSG